MKFPICIFVASLFVGAFASDCKDKANFPSSLSIGDSFPIIESIQDSGISGKLQVIGQCSFQLKELTFKDNSKYQNIQFYGVGTFKEFPISKTVLKGTFEPGSASALKVKFFDTSVNQISPTNYGIAWNDFTAIRIYSVASKIVLAEIKLPAIQEIDTVRATMTKNPNRPTPLATKLESARRAVETTSENISGIPTPTSSALGRSISIAVLVLAAFGSLF